MLTLSMLLSLTAFADAPKQNFVKTFTEKGPLCIEQNYGCLDAKCDKPVLYESLVKECYRSKKAKKAMGTMGDSWNYMRFDHMGSPKPAPTPQASAIPNLPPVKVPEGVVAVPASEETKK